MKNARTFTILSLDCPDSRAFTYQIYPEQESDYGNENNGKPFNSFIAHNGHISIENSGYIRSMKEAEKFVSEKAKERLNKRIKYSVNLLKMLRKDKKLLDTKGIKAFETFA